MERKHTIVIKYNISMGCDQICTYDGFVNCCPDCLIKNDHCTHDFIAVESKEPTSKNTMFAEITFLLLSQTVVHMVMRLTVKIYSASCS